MFKLVYWANSVRTVKTGDFQKLKGIVYELYQGTLIINCSRIEWIIYSPEGKLIDGNTTRYL